jgi:hypothetical protein
MPLAFRQRQGGGTPEIFHQRVGIPAQRLAEQPRHRDHKTGVAFRPAEGKNMAESWSIGNKRMVVAAGVEIGRPSAILNGVSLLK